MTLKSVINQIVTLTYEQCEELLKLGELRSFNEIADLKAGENLHYRRHRSEFYRSDYF